MIPSDEVEGMRMASLYMEFYHSLKDESDKEAMREYVSNPVNKKHKNRLRVLLHPDKNPKEEAEKFTELFRFFLVDYADNSGNKNAMLAAKTEIERQFKELADKKNRNEIEKSSFYVANDFTGIPLLRKFGFYIRKSQSEEGRYVLQVQNLKATKGLDTYYLTLEGSKLSIVEVHNPKPTVVEFSSLEALVKQFKITPKESVEPLLYARKNHDKPKEAETKVEKEQQPKITLTDEERDTIKELLQKGSNPFTALGVDYHEFVSQNGLNIEKLKNKLNDTILSLITGKNTISTDAMSAMVLFGDERKPKGQTSMTKVSQIFTVMQDLKKEMAHPSSGKPKSR